MAIDPSAVYFYNGIYYIRCYVHYKIVSTNIKTRYSDDEMYLRYNRTPYNNILFSNKGFVDLTDYKLGQWVNGIFDITIASAIDGTQPETYGVAMTYWTLSKTRTYERN